MLGFFLPVVLAGSYAAALDHDTLELPANSVEGRAVENGPGDGSRLDQTELRRFVGLEDAVNALPGFRVRRQGGLGGYSELSFRGADASNVEVYLDGLRLNQEGDPAPDLAKWPLLWFSGVAASTGFGVLGAGDPGSLARLDLTTTPPSGNTEVTARQGSFSTSEAAALVQGGSEWKWNVGLEGQRSRNDYPYYDDRGTIYNPADDAIREMNNNGYWSRGARASLRRESAQASQVFSLLGLDDLKQYPGLFPASAQAYSRRTEGQAGWRGTAYFGQVMADAGLQARRFEDHYRDPGQSLGYLSYATARAGTAWEGEAGLQAPVFGSWELGTDSRLRWETVDPLAKPYSQTLSSPSSARLEAQSGLTAQVRLIRNFLLTAEVRGAWVRFSADSVATSPIGDSTHSLERTLRPVAMRLGAQWKSGFGSFDALGRLEHHAPSSLELLGDNQGIRENPSLAASETRSLNLSHNAVWDKMRVQNTVFANRYLQPIRVAPLGSSPFLRYENGSEYRAVGWEGEMHFQRPHFEGGASWTWQDIAIVQGPAQGHWPAYQSPIEGHAEWWWKPNTLAEIGPELSALGPTYPGDANLPATRRAWEWDWGVHAGYKLPGPRCQLAFDARNLLDQHYRDFAASVRSGRSYDLNLSFQL